MERGRQKKSRPGAQEELKPAHLIFKNLNPVQEQIWKHFVMLLLI